MPATRKCLNEPETIYYHEKQVYGNDFSAVGNGALKVLVGEQGDICGNTCVDELCALTG